VAKASLGGDASPTYEMSGRFALPDASVVGTFRWFELSPDVPRLAPRGNPRRLGRVEARGHETAIVAWFGDDALRIFRSETPRGTSFRCGCSVELEAVPTPGRVVAEALSCMHLPVGRGGLKMRVTREREVQGVGAITRSVRGMPRSPDEGDWECDAAQAALAD
jgi:hypothetical protein